MVELITVAEAVNRDSNLWQFVQRHSAGSMTVRVEKDTQSDFYWLTFEGGHTAAVGAEATVYAIPMIAEVVRRRAISEGAPGYAEWVHGE